jgi:hypothetical protein
VPATEWCLGPLRGEVARRLSAGRLIRAGWFEPGALRQLRRGQERSDDPRRRRVGENLWLLFMLHVWLVVNGQALIWPTARGGNR